MTTKPEPIQPVAWRKENPAFVRYTGDGWPPVRYLFTETKKIATDEPGWVPLYTADQIRQALEYATRGGCGGCGCSTWEVAEEVLARLGLVEKP